MMSRARVFLVPMVLSALAWCTAFLTGCKPQEKAPEVSVPKADPPSVYMKDPAFRAALKEKRVERNQMMAVREKLIVEAERRVDAMKAKFPGADDEAVKKELEKDPEWNSLIRRIEAATEAVGDNQRATGRIVRDRLVPQKKSSSEK